MFNTLFAERGLSIDRLRALIEVAQAGSIARAVRGDPVRQSQYSRQIKELETFFGIELTRRRGKVLVLSTAGRELVKIAGQYFSSLDDFRTSCKNLPRRFTVGAGDSIHHWMVSPILSALAEERRPWLFTLTNLRNDAIAEKLLDMDLDFGILRKNSIVSDIIKFKTIQCVRYALYVPQRLVARGRRDDYKWCFANVPCATLAFDSTFASMLYNCCAEQGLQLDISIHTQSFPFAAELLKSKNHMAILPEICEKCLPGGILKLSPPFFKMLERDLAIAWNPRQLSVRPAIRQVLNYFIEKLSP